MSPFAHELEHVKTDDTVDFVCFDEETAQPEIITTRIENIIEQTGRLVVQGMLVEDYPHPVRVIATLQTDGKYSPSGHLLITREATVE
jgi:hypothetical protein